MSFPSLTDDELDLGIDAAYKKYGCTIKRHNLIRVSDRLQQFRLEGLGFENALRETMNFHNLQGERREWYKVALGKAFSSRAKPMHKGRTSKRRIERTLDNQHTVDKRGQYGFVLTQ